MLHLPIAHCELNPIELAWASVKGYVAKHNKDFNMKETERLTVDGFKHTTTDMWRNVCRHVVDVENGYTEKDGICEDTVEEMGIEIGEEDDDSDDDGDELMDDNDRELSDRTLDDTSTSTPQTDTETCTNPRRNLTDRLQDYEPNFLESVLPLP